MTICVENYVVDEVYSGMNMDARPGPYVMLAVTDTGVGIPLELQDRVFEPFFSTKDIGQGTGLGLSTSFAIVKEHGGFLKLESEPGKGTTFRVYLPAPVGLGKASGESVGHDRLPVGHGELILVVDDEEHIREVTRRALERFGYRVLTASNGAEGVSLYVQHQREVSIVLTDMSMPVMDGPAMIFALKTINPTVRIIGSSGLAAEENATKADDLGVERFVPKPYTASTLLLILQELLAVQRPPETGHILVLISDNDERELCCCMLETAGYPVWGVSCEMDASEWLDGKVAGVRLLIVDALLAIPIGDRLIDRASRQRPDFSVLLLTGAEDHLPALQAGVARSFSVFERPLRAEAFIRKVRTCLSR